MKEHTNVRRSENPPFIYSVSSQNSHYVQVIHFLGDISEEIRYKIINLHKKGENQRKISDKTLVSQNNKTHREHGTPDNCVRPVKSLKLSPSEK